MDPNQLMHYLAFIPGLIIAITFHEYAHARTAVAFGDQTPRTAGRLTLNPLAHLDPIGTLMIVIAGFGWGKPVPVDPRNFKHPRADLLVSGAGPGMNLVMAVLFGLALRDPRWLEWLNRWELGTGAAILCLSAVQLNLMLGLFNLLPIGSLDGASVLQNLLPSRLGDQFAEFNRNYGGWILLGLILSSYVLPVSPVGLLIGPPIRSLTELILGRS